MRAGGSSEGGGHIARAALSLMHYQAESGTSCPLTMTFAAIPALRTNPDAFRPWIEKGLHPGYDPRNVSVDEKAGAVFGMSMTEKTGGSDVRSNTTRAVVLTAGGDGRDAGSAYSLTGHKWFTSAPMCDAFLTLAYSDAPSVSVSAAGTGSKAAATAGQLSCFLVPRWLAPATRNAGFRVVRLKEKLGDRSNASSEVEYDGAVGYLVVSALLAAAPARGARRVAYHLARPLRTRRARSARECAPFWRWWCTRGWTARWAARA